MEMLDTLNKEEKATMMLVTHDPYAASFLQPSNLHKRWSTV